MVCGWSTNRRDREPWPVRRQASTTTSRMSQANTVMFLETLRPDVLDSDFTYMLYFCELHVSCD